MKNLSSWLIVMFILMFWLFRVIVAITGSMGLEFVTKPINNNVEIILLFVVLACVQNPEIYSLGARAAGIDRRGGHRLRHKDRRRQPDAPQCRHAAADDALVRGRVAARGRVCRRQAVADDRLHRELLCRPRCARLDIREGHTGAAVPARPPLGIYSGRGVR